MSYPSVAEKSRVLNLIYRLTNSIYGKEVKIERDPLHLRYEVNRYGIYLSSKTVPLKLLSDKLKKELLIKLDSELEKSFWLESIVQKTKNNNLVRISMDSSRSNDKLYIMIH